MDGWKYKHRLARYTQLNKWTKAGNPIALLLSLSARNIHQYTAKQSFNFLKRGQDHLLRSLPRSYLQQMNWGLKCWVFWLSFCNLRPAPYIHVARQVNEVRWLSCQPHQGSHGIWLLFHESDRFLLSGSWSTSDHKSNPLVPIITLLALRHSALRIKQAVFGVRQVSYQLQIVALELKDPIWHSLEWQIGSFSSEATKCWLQIN